MIPIRAKNIWYGISWDGFVFFNENTQTHAAETNRYAPQGMFADDKKHGPGLCITVDGRYFEGIFVDNELNGNGVAIFNQGTYYEGEMIVHGPSGRGTMFLPIEAIRCENGLDELDEHKSAMRGNVLTGSLGGQWEDVKINSGTIAMNRERPKYSR